MPAAPIAHALTGYPIRETSGGLETLPLRLPRSRPQRARTAGLRVPVPSNEASRTNGDFAGAPCVDTI